MSVTPSSTLIDSGFKNVSQAPYSTRPYRLICCVCFCVCVPMRLCVLSASGREATVCLH